MRRESHEDEDDDEDDEGEGGADVSDWGMLNVFGFLSVATAAPDRASAASSSSSGGYGHGGYGEGSAHRPTTPGPRDRSSMDGVASPFRLFTPTKQLRGNGHGNGAPVRRGSKRSSEKKKPPAGKPVERLIGLLDIFGFENFQVPYLAPYLATI